MIPLRSYVNLLATALVLLSPGPAEAADPPTRVTITLSCKDVQALVVLVGGWNALTRIAVDGGASKLQIEEVMRCKP